MYYFRHKDETYASLYIYCVNLHLFAPFIGDSLGDLNNMKFTTFDRDNDIWDKNCAQHFLGGFWYNNCHHANPNGMYAPQGTIAYSSVQVIWNTYRGSQYSLKTIEMKIRPVLRCGCNE